MFFVPGAAKQREIEGDNMGKIRDSQKKIAVINDLSGFGRCSIAVELPIISAMKILILDGTGVSLFKDISSRPDCIKPHSKEEKQ